MNNARVRNYIRRFVKISTEVVDKIPTSADSLLVKTLKTIALADTIHGFVFGKKDPVKEYLGQYDVESDTNQSFVRLVFSTRVANFFKSTVTSIDLTTKLIEVKVEGNGRLYFIEYISENETSRSDEFYFTRGFDFEAFLAKVWSFYDGKIHVTLQLKDYRYFPCFSTFTVPKNPIFGSAQDLLKKMKKKDKRYRIDNVARSYMYIGPPGTGKSTFAQQLCSHSSKIIKFDAKSLDNISLENMNFLIEGLKPDYVIIDDIDKVIFSSSVATLLDVLETIKYKYPETTVVLTANEYQLLDRALIRPGRIDEIIEFDCQNDKDRRDILKGYAKEMGVTLSKKNVTHIIKQTAGLSAAYLREVVVQLKYSPMEDVLSTINTMRKILDLIDDEEDEEKESKKKKRKDKKRKRKDKDKRKEKAIARLKRARGHKKRKGRKRKGNKHIGTTFRNEPSEATM